MCSTACLMSTSYFIIMIIKCDTCKSCHGDDQQLERTISASNISISLIVDTSPWAPHHHHYDLMTHHSEPKTMQWTSLHRASMHAKRQNEKINISKSCIDNISHTQMRSTSLSQACVYVHVCFLEPAHLAYDYRMRPVAACIRQAETTAS